MRIKFLAIIASFIFVSIAISSCLDSDDNTIELSSDATVHAFALDTIYGKHYKFTIDQLHREIYNQDSLPVGADTIIDRILIDTFLVSGWITAGLNDTVFVQTDSVDLTGAVNNNDGIKFKVHAPDLSTVREYTLKIRRHKQGPGSLVWDRMASALPGIPSVKGQKAILFNNDLWVFTQNAAYKTSTKPSEYGWETADVYIDFPTDAKLATLVNVKYEEGATSTTSREQLYIVTENKQVFTSQDGIQWEIVPKLGSDVQALVAGFPNTLTVITDNGVYSTSDNGESQNSGQFDDTNYHPTANIYSANFETNYQLQTIMVGTTSNSDLSQTVPWVSNNGRNWFPLDNTAYDAFCPALKNPVVMNYGNIFYIFGSEDVNRLNVIYSSVDGISWRKTEKKFLLDKDMAGITAPYSIVVDSPYIWVIFGGDGKTNAVWRGHLNKLMPAIP